MGVGGCTSSMGAAMAGAILCIHRNRTIDWQHIVLRWVGCVVYACGQRLWVWEDALQPSMGAAMANETLCIQLGLPT